MEYEDEAIDELVCAHYVRIKDECCAHEKGGCEGPMFMRCIVLDSSDGNTETLVSQLCEAHAKGESVQFEQEVPPSYARQDNGHGWSILPILDSAAPAKV